MLRDILIGQYLPGDSLIHQLDPRTKILSGFIYLATLFLVKTYNGYLISALFLFALIVISQISWKYFLRGLKPVLFIVVLTLIMHLLWTPGELWVQAGPLVITREGVWRGGEISLRLILLITGASLLTLTTSPISFTDGLERLLSVGRKIKLPAHELAMMMSIALQFIPILAEEADKIIKAQTARGLSLQYGNLWERIKLLTPLLVPLLISVFRRAEDLTVSMESRCYRGGRGRTRLKELKWKRKDYLALAIVVFLPVTVFFLKW